MSLLTSYLLLTLHCHCTETQEKLNNCPAVIKHKSCGNLFPVSGSS